MLGGSAFAVIVGVIVLVFFAASAQRFLMSLPQTAAVITAVLVELANGDRASNLLSALTVDAKLTAAAQAKANDMAAKSYFAHVSPDGKDPWYWFKEAGYSFAHAGENLAVDFSDSEDVEKAWMNSPAHRENILDGKYTQIGIAIAEGTYQGRKTIFVVQEFGTPLQAPVPQQIAVEQVPLEPTSVATAEAQRQEPVAENTKPEPQPQRVLGTTQGEETSSPPPEIDTQSQNAGPIANAMASPRHALQYAYLFLGVFLIIALAYTTRFEMKKHHLRHVKAVTLLVCFMGAILLASNYVVFNPPTVLPSEAATGVRG